MKRIYCERDLKNPYFLEREIKNIKYNIKLCKYYLDNPTSISELKYIRTYKELLDFNDELHERLKFVRKTLKKLQIDLENGIYYGG